MQISITLLVTVRLLFFGMLPSVKFYNKSICCDIKIYDVIADLFLSVYRYRQSIQKLIPQPFFFRRHIFSQFLCDTGQFFVILI